MADGPTATPEQLDVPGEEAATDLRAWRSYWQVPAIVLGLVLIVAGLMQFRTTPEVVTLDQLLAAVEARLLAGELEEARTLLQDHIEPQLSADDLPSRAHFHMLVADWLAVQQAARGTRSAREDAIITDQYRLARELGRTLDPVRLERYAAAMIAAGRLPEAYALLSDLQQLAASDPQYVERRGRLLRLMADASLAATDLSTEEQLLIIERFRSAAASVPADHAWSLAREADIRLAGGDAEEAITRLLIGMRRLEGMQPPVSEAVMGELYLRLARAHLQAGRFGDAVMHADIAERSIPRGDEGLFEIALVRAEVAIAGGNPESAHEHLTPVVEEGRGTPPWARGVMLRGEVRGVLGERTGSLEDFAQLRRHLAGAEARDGVYAVDVAASLVDRHDASLLAGELDAALEYLDMAHSFFQQHAVPEIVLERTAATSKALADRIMADAMERGAPGMRWEDVAAEVRRASMHAYDRAAAAFERLARAQQIRPDDSGGWAQSLRLAGECHDLAGRPDRAAERFREYLDQHRAERDPERSMVQFMLGRALAAERRFDEAVEALTAVIEDDPNIVGTRAHVPLARARVAAGRLDEAIRGLERVVDGRGIEAGPLTPEAEDHHTALVELAEILHESARRTESPEERRQLLVRAIERLTQALDRRPDGARATELVYRIGDAHRRLADLEDAWLADAVLVSPSERHRREEQAAEHRRTAIARLAEVAGALGDTSLNRLTPFQREMQRGAWMGRADALYALGSFDAAVRLYDRAARMFGDEPDAVAALIQVVNCYDRMGRQDLADAAHRYALERITAMPDHMFNDPRALLSRRAWEEWMAHRPVGLAAAAQETMP